MMNKALFICLFGLLIALSVFSQNTILGVDSVCRNTKVGALAASGEQPSDAEITERIQIINKMLDRNEKGLQRWWYGWLGLYGAATLGQGTVACLTEDKVLKQDMILGAGTTLFGVVGQLIAPVKSGYEAEQFEQTDYISKNERLEKLRQAEGFLEAQAKRAKSGKNWQMHLVSGVVNLSSGLVTWIGYKRSLWAGVENFALNMVVTEIQIWSQPAKAMNNYKQYCNKYNLTDYQSSKRPEFVWYAHVQPGGVGLGVSF